MKSLSCHMRVACAFLLALFMWVPATSAWPQDSPVFSQQELDQMLAPVALYPDGLLSQILMAASYPLEVVEAQRWTLANPSVTGNAAVQAVDQNNWDPSVKSLLAFPRILQTMSSNLDWTRRLGDAFLGQQQQVMDTIQSLRQKAYAAGNLVSNAQDRVAVVDGQVTVSPINPQIVYAPYYDPNVVYGPWWWPQYPPIAWAPWPGYTTIDGFGPGFMWGAGVVLAADFLCGSFDWNTHHVNVNYAHFHDRSSSHNGAGVGPWEHNPKHRQGVGYRQPPPHGPLTAPLAVPPERREFRGFQPAPVLPAMPAPHLARPSGQALAPSANVRQPMAPKPHAFENIDQGRAVRDFSARGQNSVRPSAPPTDARCPPGGCTPGASHPQIAPNAPQGGHLIRQH